MSGTRDGKPATTLGVIHTITYRTLPETWFYKITGDTPAVVKEKDAFRDYVRSTRYPVMFKFPFVGGYLWASCCWSTCSPPTFSVSSLREKRSAFS
ncbi:MAG: hypothetical protein CM1200mP29_02620 [Verrucomicrobiota bacterium]|nr:MAG: hypothetical protein CM1200mP29_02620 [Verrucomicrobiota bacterium]